jgi:hypothetical protein
MRSPTVLFRGIALLLALVLAVAAAPPGNERLLQQQLKQQQIQKTTQRVADQLSSIINEFDRNGISGEDVKVLRAIRSVLGRLSEREMAQVIALLQQAEQSGDDLTSKRNVTEAYSNQKTIITQLKQLLLEYQRQQALYEISIMLRGLASRQSANMRLGVWLARTTDQKGGVNGFSEDEKRYLQQQGIDEAALRDETALVIKKIEALAKETDGTATGERPKAALDQVKSGGLMSALDAAIDDLKNSKLLSATGNEKKARDQMRDVARALLMSKDLVDLLRAAIQETENTIIQQKAVIEFTRKMERKEEARDAEDKQFEVVDNTDLTRRDINDVVPTAASYFRDAIGRMQEARELLSANHDIRKKVKEAPPKEMDGLTNLELAKRELQEALAKAEKEAQRPESILANLRELRKQVDELIKREEKLKQETAANEQNARELKARAPTQGEIRDDTQTAQQSAANDAPEAASALNEAANQMEKAQKDLAQSRNSPAAEQAAIDSLKKAGEELDKQIAKLEAAEKQLAQLEELQKKVEKVITDEQKIRLDTAKEAVKEKPDSTDKVAAKQQDTSKETAGIHKEAQEPVPSAAEHLAKATNQMEQAKSELDKSQPKNAQPPETKALNELYAAKKEIETKMNELRKELGQPESMEQSLADADAALEKAQKEVNEAQAQMQDPGLMDALQKRQQAIANALGEQAKKAPSQKTSEAQKSAEKAAQQLGESNLKQAIGEMEKAESAIEAANNIAPQQPQQPGDPTKPLPEIGQEQREVKSMAQQLLAAQESANQQAMQNAANSLEQALNDVSPIAAGQAGQLPSSADRAVQQAQSALTMSAAQAGANQQQPAQQNASQAAQALAQARAALALAQAGLNSEMAGQQPGQGQQPGKGQGQKGQGQSPGQQPGKGQGTPPPRGDSKDGNWSGAGGANGAHSGTAGSSSFIGLPKRDRAAIQQSQAEKYPQEYGPLVEQYLKNLSDDAGK